GYFKPGETFAGFVGKKKAEETQVAQGRGPNNQEGDKGKPSADGEKGKTDKKPVDAPPGDAKQQPPQPAPEGRKIIRSGDIEFEVDSFDTAVAIVSRLVNAKKGGFVATINSDKLANGKVRGSVVVRVPPEFLDALVLALRAELTKAGDLKSQRIGSQDVTKQYTDLESRLKAARTMEERLLRIIRDGKGEIKDLLLAEKELGVWRTRIEELEGELRYYGNLVALSTLTIALTEKEIRTAAAVMERERIQTGIEVEDVEKAMRDTLGAVTEAKGRVTRSELKQHGAGQLNALLHFEVKPDLAGQVRDRLRQLGTTARLEIDRVQQAEGGGNLPRDGKLNRGDTQFLVSLYNLVNVAPRETVTLKVAAADVPAAYNALRDAIGKVQGRVVNAQLNEQDRQNVTAQLDFDFRRLDEGAIKAALAAAGETLSRHVARIPAGENVTDAKLLFKVEFLQANNIPPREIVTLALEVAEVETTLGSFTNEVKDAGGRNVQLQVGQERNGRVTARVVYDVPLNAAQSLIDRFRKAGQVRVHQVARNQQAPEGKLALARLDVTLSNGELLVPEDESLWSQVRSGLGVSLRGLSVSASWLIVGLLFVLPWVLLIYAGVAVGRRMFRKTATPAPAYASSGPAATGA
ncbi:MAG: DUF4349 domain-containing protein, partial [Gemmataceae bacterium]|nr:DUF4349 domain-containing protein [Gemmataceae bacterium]